MKLSPTIFRDLKTPRHMRHLSEELGEGDERMEGIHHIEDSRFAQRVVDSGFAGDAETRVNVMATTDELAAVSHLMTRDPKAKDWRMHEVRSSNQINQRYLREAAFRRGVFEAVGWPIAGTNLTYPSRRDGKGNSHPRKRFETRDISGIVQSVQLEIQSDIEAAIRFLMERDLAKVPGCKKPKDCSKPEACFPNIEKGAYTVYDIARIRQNVLEEMLESGIIYIDDVEDPEAFGLNEKQIQQVLDAKNRVQMLDTEKLAEMFKKVQFPVYFLDYEGYQPSKPMYEGFAPRQTIVYQYSLHILEDPDQPGRIEHYEFLSDGKENPHVKLLEKLQKEIGPKGTVVVHHKQYEATRHLEMAEMFPEHAEFLHGLNSRIFDLEEVFLKGAWRDHRFKGRTSIKPIIEAIFPGLSHKKLKINKGDKASEIWGIMVHTGDQDYIDEKTIESLEYCGRDTLVMVALFLKMLKHLKQPDKRTWKE